MLMNSSSAGHIGKRLCRHCRVTAKHLGKSNLSISGPVHLRPQLVLADSELPLLLYQQLGLAYFSLEFVRRQFELDVVVSDYFLIRHPNDCCPLHSDACPRFNPLPTPPISKGAILQGPPMHKLTFRQSVSNEQSTALHLQVPAPRFQHPVLEKFTCSDLRSPLVKVSPRSNNCIGPQNSLLHRIPTLHTCIYNSFLGTAIYPVHCP